VSGFFLGVDGGQSSTTALLADESAGVLGCGRGGPCEHVGAEGGREKFAASMAECLSLACAQAGLDPATVTYRAACLGFSGGPVGKEPILREMIRTERLVLRNDAWIALAGATVGGAGIITIAGTGSVTLGRNADGKAVQAGGWGYLFGDESGGFDIARQALRAALRFQEGWGPPTVLGDVLLEATGARDLQDLLHRFYTTEFPRSRVARYAPLVDRAALQGDAVAIEIMHGAARYLAELTLAVRRQLFREEERVRVSHIGGMFRSPLLLETYRLLVGSERNLIGPPAFGPAAGALIEAFQAAGIRPVLSGLPENEK